MFNWVEIGLENNKARYETLSQFLNQSQFPNQVEFLQTTKETFTLDIQNCLEKYDGIRVGRGCGEIVLPLFNSHVDLVDKIHAADAIVKLDKKWWLRSNAVAGFSRVLARVGNSLDLDSHVLIVGAGAAARVAITALFMIGFKSFAISNLDEISAQNLVKDLSRTLLGVKFRIVPKEGLILLPGVHGIMVNTTPLSDDNPMLEELYYFNFFKVGGVAVDFSIVPIETPLLKAAKEVGAHCVQGFRVSAFTDLIWAEQVSGKQFPELQYEEMLEKALS